MSFLFGRTNDGKDKRVSDLEAEIVVSPSNEAQPVFICLSVFNWLKSSAM